MLIAFTVFCVGKKISPVRTEICELSQVTTTLYLDKLITAVLIKCLFSKVIVELVVELGLTVSLETTYCMTR